MSPPRKKKLIILIGSDGESSARPVEAVRIAAGMASWKNLEIHVVFQGVSTKCLEEGADTLCDGDQLNNYLTVLRNGEASVYEESLDLAALSRLCADADQVASF